MHGWPIGAAGALVLLGLVAGCMDAGAPRGAAAETVYRNGRIYTVDTAQPWAEALAIRDGWFVAVGADEDIAEWIGDDTEVVDLGGRFVMPGIQDAHVHTQMVAEFEHSLSVDPDLGWKEIAETIRSYAAEHPERLWILGGNLPWLEATIGASDVPAHRATLDALAPEHAVALWDVGGHAMLASSRALELAGIDRTTPDPPGGTIEHDAAGEPTGVLRELATNLILENAESLTVEQYADGIERAMARLSSLGVTSFHEVWAYPRTLEALAALDREGRLRARVVAAIAHPVEFTSERAKQAAREAIARRRELEGSRLRVPYVKFVLDGSAGGRTLVLTEPYEGTDFLGELRNPAETALQEVPRLQADGLGSVLHAVGDGAIRLALDAIARARAEQPESRVRHVVAHTVFVNPEDLDRFAQLDAIAELSPYFWWPNDGQEMLRSELGERRLGWAYPARELLESGARIAVGSDWPVVFDPNPFPALEALVTRERPGGSEDAFGLGHAISIEEAIEAFTLGSAYDLQQEESTGSIEVGKLADFIVLDRNLLEVPIRQIHGAVVERTVLGGEVIMRRDAADDEE